VVHGCTVYGAKDATSLKDNHNTTVSHGVIEKLQSGRVSYNALAN
jgi:hypothetical protein